MKYAKRLVSSLVLILVLSVSSYADTDVSDILVFDDSGVMVDTEVSNIFDFPDITAGYMIDARNSDYGPYIGLELYEYNRYTLDLGFAQNNIFAGVGYNIIPIYEIHVMAFYGYNLEENRSSYGAAAGIIKF